MNYYEHHIGDFAKDAGYLTMAEEGAYRRLIDAYYTRERPLPADVRECCKLAKAVTKPEKTAVAYVLREFFSLADDGFHQSRCDEEIAKYHDSEPEREAKREGQRERQKRTRERRRELFEVLRQAGIVPEFDVSMSELSRMASRVTSQLVTRHDTATQTPLPTSHSSTYVEEQPHTPAAPAVSGQFEGHTDPLPPPSKPRAAGAAAVALNRAGCKVTSQNPNLIAATADGVTAEHLLEVVHLNPGKPAGYVIAIARRELAERAATVTIGATHAQPRKESLAERVARKTIAEELADRAQHAERDDDARTLGSDVGAVRTSLVGVVR